MQPSWRSVLPVHPAAELFPPLGDDELHQLGADTRKHGLREPVVLQRQYRRRADDSITNEHDYELALVDGRGRLDSMEKADFTLLRDGKLDKTRGHGALGLEPLTGGAYAELDPRVDPYAFVMSRNIRRWHLTPKQKRNLIAKLLKADPDKSDRQVAENDRQWLRRRLCGTRRGRKQRRVDRRLDAVCVLTAMQRGEALHQHFSREGPIYPLTNGQPVAADVAALVITDIRVVPVNDGLFPGTPQTWRWTE
jgi:hypothetical protein